MTYSLGDLEKAGWKQASKKKLMAITGVLFFIFLTSKLQLLTSDAETLAIFRLCDTSKSGSISERVSWRCIEREIKKINIQCDPVILIFFESLLITFPSILTLWSISTVEEYQINAHPFQGSQNGSEAVEKETWCNRCKFCQNSHQYILESKTRWWKPQGFFNCFSFVFFFQF